MNKINKMSCLDNIKIIKLISNTTIYGLIWDVIYKDEISCALKIVILDSGIHRHTDGHYYNNNRRLSSYRAQKYFVKGDNPFNHEEFIYKKAMNEKIFLKEARNIQLLSEIDLSPHVYDFGIHQGYDIHYGFILMEKTDFSLKDVLHNRDLNLFECKVISEKIDLFHNSGFIHNDLKPSNIGIYLNIDGLIYKCYVFDCSKVKRYNNTYSSRFKSYIKKDWKHYDDHVNKNIKSKLKLLKSH
jgi:serine/threonine protein kinase